ncbi:MAG TPA: FHA domain-containing protein, partial [Alphaproteobacteria bacterium]|nr:FHA domain-containing protein [Alphaproteobacteria bacterium]
MARLIISSPDGKKGVMELNKPVITIGRGNANDLVMNDSSVSRFHAVVKVQENSVLIADRGSTNGVVLNGRKIAQDHPLKSGDVAVIGRYELRLESGDDRGIQVRRAEWPSTLNQIMRGHTRQGTQDSSVGGATVAELLTQIKKLERENYLLSVLYDSGKALNGKLSIEDISAQVMSLAFRIEGVERGFIMLLNEAGEVAQQSEVRYRTAPSAGNPPQIILSKSVLELVRKEQQPILIDDVKMDHRFSGSESVRISGLRSAMCAPLLGSKRLFGILYVDNME